MSFDAAEDVLEALAGLPTFHHPAVAPDGETVACYYDVTGRNELHLLDATTGTHRRVTDGQVPRSARWPVAWAGADEVVFHLDEAGDEQNDLHVVDRSGTSRPVVEAAGQAALGDVTDDGRVLVFGSTRDGQMNLYRHDRDAGETTKLTDHDRAASGAVLSPSGHRVAYVTNERDDPENRDTHLIDVDGANARRLGVGEAGAEVSPVDFWSDGDRLLVADNSPGTGRSGVVDLTTDEVTWYGDGTGVPETPVAVLRGGDRFVAHRTRDATVVPVVYDVTTGGSRELDLPTGVAAVSDGRRPQLGDGRLVVTTTTPTTRSALVAYDLEADETETLLAPEYGPFEPETFAGATYLTVSSDGVPETPQAAVEHDPAATLEVGALLYDAGVRPSPLVVNPHGGPRAMDDRSFDLYTQFLVSRGYSVLQVNYRGSAGRGREFAERLYGDWGGAEQGDIATATEHVLATRDWLDPDRVAVFGGSYGGYSAYWQTVQYPDLYDAGVAWIGLTDLREMYETTMPHFRTELLEKNLGSPDERPGLYRERSPVEHAANLDCPLLIVHGVNDRRVPVGQARLYRDRLRDLGDEDGEDGEDGDFEYVELGDEGHASSDIDQKIRLFRILGDFLDRRLG